MSHDQIIEALGAFALDALDPEEAESIRRHLEECPSCAAEVSEHQRVAALLGNTGGEAPAHLWEEIAGKIGENRPPAGYREPRLGEVVTLPDGRRRSAAARGLRGAARRPWLLAVAAAAVAIALLSIQTVRLNDRVGSLNARNATQAVSHLVQEAMASPGAQKVDLVRAAGPQVTDAKVVVLPSGAAYLVNQALPALPGDQTYQLWGRSGAQLISLGVLGNRPGTVAFSVGSTPYSAYVVTAERAGGVVRSTHAPVAAGSVAA